MLFSSFFKRLHTLPSGLGHAEAERLENIEQEFLSGYAIKKKFPKSVTIYGSARFDSSDKHYQHAEVLAERLATECGYTIVTGGGKGIMEAANKGGSKSGKPTVGLNIKLPHEQTLNEYVTENLEFDHFFSRKVILSLMTSAYIFYPGGFGTLDEFFEILTLIQTHKVPKKPIILVGNDYWLPLKSFVETHLYEHHMSVDKQDLDLFVIEENFDRIVEMVKAKK